MPSKSRRSRRNMPRNNPITTETETARHDSTPAYSSPVVQSERVIRPGRIPTAVPAPPSNILNEIKWISVVALIIVAILIVLYYTVR